MLEQVVLEYAGFSQYRGRCHVVFDRAESLVLVGEPIDNPGTSVTNVVEEVAFSLKTSLDLDATKGKLFQYVPWDATIRRERTMRVEFQGDAWSMPTWVDADTSDPFVYQALELAHAIEPYALTEMKLPVIKSIVRLRIDATGVPEAPAVIAAIGDIAHISQHRFYYIDVRAMSDEAAIAHATRALGGHIGPDGIYATSPNAPLDQPGSLPV